MQVRRISTTTELGTLAETWGALHQNSEQRNNIFLTYEWLETWWRTIGEPQKLQLFLLVIEEAEGNIVGIAPLVRQKQRWLPTMPIRKIIFMGSDVSDYLGFISCPGREHAVAETVAFYLQEHRQDWDLLELTSLPESSTLLVALFGGFSHNYLVREEPYVTSLYVRLEGTWNEYLQLRRPKFRKNFRRDRRLFENRLNGRFVICERNEQVSRALEHLFLLNSERQKSKGTTSNLANARRQSFHQEIARLFLVCGWLNCTYLEVENEIAAVIYNYRYGQSGLFYNIGFDPKWSSYSPGKLLLGHSIEKAFLEGVEEFDLLQGDYSYKYDWSTHSRQVHRMLVLQPQLKVRIWYKLRECWQKTENQARNRMKAYLPKHLRVSLKLSFAWLQLLLKRISGRA